MKIGIMGCGVISRQYIRDIRRLYRGLEIVMVADIRQETAEETAKEFGIAQAGTPEQLLAEQGVELVVNLTPPAMHTVVNRRILQAGKHVFCEKPFALTLEEAQEIQRLAVEKGLSVGGAPDTYLGSAQSTCRKLLRDGWIGRPLYVCANMMSAGVETWHPRPEPFYQPGGGPLYDMGPYYFSALTAMFGAVRQVQAVAGTGLVRRTVYTPERFGQRFAVETPTHFSALLEMAGGVLVNANFSFDVWKSELPLMEIYGTEGTLSVPDPNMTGGTPRIYRRERALVKCYGAETVSEQDGFMEVPELYQNVGAYVRGAGVQKMVQALAQGQRLNAVRETHVVDIITSVLRAAKSGTAQTLTTDCEAEW